MKHRAKPRFWRCYRQLPEDVQRLADESYHLLREDPRRPSLHFKRIGRFWSVRVGLHYRALALEHERMSCGSESARTPNTQQAFTDPSTMTMQDRFTSRYRGKRYSFGYPARPNLDDQAGLWTLLRPEEIGVELTEGIMIEPVASVSAMVFHYALRLLYGR